MRSLPTTEARLQRSPWAFSWIVLAIFFATSSAMFSKKAAMVGQGKGILTSLLTPWYMGTLICLGLVAFVWILVLRQYPLSYAYPFMSIVRGLVLLGAWFIFQEPVQPRELLGMVIIILGIALIGRTLQR